MRLGPFVPPGTQIVKQSHWEWMEGLWHYEGIGFTWLGRPMASPGETACLELDFSELDNDCLSRLFQHLQLPLRPGMPFEELRELLGSPIRTHARMADRKSYDFSLGTEELYEVGCSVHAEQGLRHVSLIRADVLSGLAETNDNYPLRPQ